MAGLLGFLAAGAGKAYAKQQQEDVAQQRELQIRLFSAQAQTLYQERLAETQARYQMMRDEMRREGVAQENMAKHQRALELEEKKIGGRMQVEGFKAKEAMRRVGATQAGANSRLSKRLAAEAATGGGGTSKAAKPMGEASIKELHKMIESDRKRVSDLKMKMADPVKMIEPGGQLHKEINEEIGTLNERIRGLRKHMADRILY